MAYHSGALVISVATWLQQHLRATRREAAAAGGVSEATLARAIRAETGLSFRAWRRDLLRDRAQALLEEVPARSIKAISADLGFASPQSFWRWFKREHGAGPAAMRRAWLDDRKAVARRA